MGEWQHVTPDALDALLARAPRAGWLLHDVPRAVAETTRVHNARLKASIHQYQKFVDPSLDLHRMLSIVDPHDMNDVFEDITPHDGYTAEEKYSREYAQAMQVAAMMGPCGEGYMQRWHIAHKRTDPEAQRVWELDKAEPPVECIAYAHRLGWDKQKTDIVVGGFFGYAFERVQCPLIRESLRVLRTELPAQPRQRYYALFKELTDRRL